MGGHSVGGAAAIAALLTDRRIRAGFDIDGTLGTPIPEHGLSRPFLFLGRSGQADPSWKRGWKRLTGWKRCLLVRGAVHESFTDIGPLADQLGISIGADLAGSRSMSITRRYVRAFLDRHLLGVHQPLLNGPAHGFPEVTRVRL